MSSGAKQTIVGQFFEEVGHRLLGGELCRNGDGDICLWKAGATVEIKASGYDSSYGFRLDVKQIERYVELSMFPFSHAWYMLFAYRNRHQKVLGRRVMELASHNSPLEVNRYLTGTILWCVILDISIINRWKETMSHSTKSILGYLGTKTIDLKCKDVHTFANGELDRTLHGLDLDPKRYGRLSGNTAIIAVPFPNSGEVVFPTIAVLSVSGARSFRGILARRGFRMSRLS